MGQNIAIFTSTTTHGGTPVTSASTTKVNNQLVLRLGDMIACPVTGHGTNAIVSASSTVKVEGNFVAREGDTTACGASIINGSTNTKAG